MKFLSKPPFPAACLSLALAILGPGLSSARACGPFFPNTYLAAPESQLLAAPQAFFAEEMWRLAAPGTKRPKVETEPGRDQTPSAVERTAAADLAELDAALREKGMPEARRQTLVAAYAEARKTGNAGPAGLPAEFAAYWRGARAWKENDVAGARAAWEAVLALPGTERRHRATWAAYMLGRSHLKLSDDLAAAGGKDGDSGDRPPDHVMVERNPDEALRWFRRTRELAATDSADALGLAGEAKGWEARLLAKRGRFGDAIRLYLDRLAEGDTTAVQSLRTTAARLVQEADVTEFDRCVRDPQARAVAVAWLLARGGTFLEDTGEEARQWEQDGESPLDDRGVFWAGRAEIWAVAIHRAGGRELPGAERLAWLAYEGGLFALAQDWLKLAPEDSAEADWLRAKLALRGGALAEGARWLESTAGSPGLNEAHRPRVYAELARTRMAQDQPQAALAAWLAGGFWWDAAFVAERVLTIGELTSFVDTAAGREQASENPLYGNLRHLLARRMARAGQERAERYFPGDLRGPFVAYLADVRTGFDSTRSEKERAAAFWRAAQTMKEKGAGLVGTELEPDWGYWGGSFDFGSAAEARMGLPALKGGVFAPTELERARIEANPVPEKRFHYRYRAAELAWWAASLLPGDSDETAEILWEAGGWLKAKDPKAAEPFYQALVIRCGQIPLGREAARLHWFPKEWPPAVANSE